MATGISRSVGVSCFYTESRSLLPPSQVEAGMSDVGLDPLLVDVANPLIINQLWLVIEAALTRSKGREVVGLRVFKDRDQIVVALSKCLSWKKYFKSFTNPVIWGLFVDRFCLWNQGVSLLGYVLLRYD